MLSGSAGRREEETAEEALYYNTHIGPIVEEMATHIKGKNTEILLLSCSDRNMRTIITC